MALNEFLENVLRNVEVEFSIENNNIVISKKAALVANLKLLATIISSPITGIVRGPDGKPLVGVNVMVKGTNKGVVTDVNGRFSIEVEQGKTLVVSNIGYTAKEVKINGDDTIIIGWR